MCLQKNQYSFVFVRNSVEKRGREKGSIMKIELGKNNSIPQNLIKLLDSYGIKEDDIMYTAYIDVDDDYKFSNDYLILTKDKLVKAIYQGQENIQHQFGGYAPVGRENREEKPAITIYKLEDIEELNIIREITGGILFGKFENKEVYLCKFTNSKMGQFQRMKENLAKVKKKEELTKEDIEGKVKMECCPKCGTLYPDQERKVCPKCMDRKSLFVRIFKYFTVYKLRIAVMVVCFILVAVLNLLWPYLSGTILYDKVLAKNDAFMKLIGVPAGKYTLLLVMTVLTMFVTKMLIQTLGIIHGSMTAKMVPEVVAKLKQQVFQSMGKLSINFYNSRQTGGLMTRVLDDASEVTGFFIDGVPYFFTNVLTIVFTCIIMFSMNPLLAVSSLVLLPILSYTSYRMLPRLWNFYSKRHRANRRLNGQMNDNITGARVVKAFGQEDQEMNRFKKYNNGVRNAELSLASYDNRFYAMYTAVENIAAFTVWGLGAALILRGDNTLEFGVLVTFAGYVGQLNGPLDFMSYIFRWCSSSLNSAQRIFEIIDAVPEIREAENPIRPKQIKGSIELNNVTFGYDKHKPVLKNVSFQVDAGQMLGIVGRSGAGKSTLVNMISRLYDPDEGNVLIDGIDVKNMGFKELRTSIAMVSQETYIFMGTVAENIAYSRPDATRKEIIEAAIQASCHDFICKMPDGYDSIIGSSGRSLSGGEKQRISIARAILANPKILILDEATSAVDTETELAIQEALEKLVIGRTTLSIAHRLSTLRNADKLIVIDDGKVTEEGTHQELIDKKGTYYKLMELQTKALAMRGIE